MNSEVDTVKEPAAAAPPDPVMAGPGSVRRWVRHAGLLVLRGFPSWLIYMAALSVVLFVTQPYFYLQEITMLVAYLLAIAIAALTDRGLGAPHAVLLGLYVHVRDNWKKMLHMTLVLLLLCTVVQFMFGAFTGAGITVSRLYEPELVSLGLLQQAPMLALHETFAPALAFFCLATLMTNVPFATSLLQYHCMTLMGLSWGAGYRAADDAMEINLPALLPVCGLLTAIPLLLLMTLPLLAPLYLCFAASLTYAAFRASYPAGIAEAAAEAVNDPA